MRTSVYIVLIYVRRRVWEAKDSPRIPAEELQKIVESRGQKTLKKTFKRPLHHHMLFGRVSRKNLLPHPQKKLQHIFSYQTWLKHQMALASMVRWNKKMSLLAANTQDGFDEHRDKNSPCVQWNILLYFLSCGHIFLLEVLDILFRHMASLILSNANR